VKHSAAVPNALALEKADILSVFRQDRAHIPRAVRQMLAAGRHPGDPQAPIAANEQAKIQNGPIGDH
jgi:hypothetical protein